MRLKKTMSVLFSALLVLQLVPVAAFAQDGAQDSADSARAPIEELLAAGDYVEGEAIVVMRGDAGLSMQVEATELAEADAEAVALAVEGEAEEGSALADTTAMRVQSVDADTYTVQLVSDHGRTTEQLLRELYDDPNVISAEPNYIIDAAAAFGAEEAGENADAGTDAVALQTAQLLTVAGDNDESQALTTQDAVANPSDLTPYQWSLDDTLSTFTVPLSSSQAGYSLNVPGWLEGRTNANAPANASGTICVMDTGVDFDHPDLAGVAYTFSKEMQDKYGCGEHGYNASGDNRPVAGQYVVGEHGSHVAGIIAAQWNAEGTSGVAHGVKLFGVNVFGGTGTTMVMSSVIKGFGFLADVAREVNLKAVNCSWGTRQAHFALAVMVNKLGAKGVNTVIASGNFGDDIDVAVDFGSVVNSPYAIVVDAALPNGKMTDFSCYGQMATDVFAPGASIFSTIAHEVKIETYGTVDGNNNYTRFFPEATAAENLLDLERFDSDTPGVRFFDTNPTLNADAVELRLGTDTLSIDTSNGYDDSRSVAVDVLSLKREPASATRGFVPSNGYLYLAIPVAADRVADTKWLSVNLAMSNSFKPTGSLCSLTCVNENGETVELGTAAAQALKTGWNVGATYPVYQCQWMSSSFSVEGLMEAANEAHEIIAAGGSIGEETEAGKFEYDDPGRITGVYGWQPDGATGQTYVIARVGLGVAEHNAQPAAGTTLYIDNVAVGSGDAFTGAYVLMSGTSMAAPAVTGCMGVIANGEPENSTLSDDELAAEARARTAKLLASVEYDDDLAGFCRTGGRVNLAKNPGFTKKAPLIQDAVVDNATLTISGWFFGSTAGTLEIDGEPVVATSWADGEVVASLAGLGLSNSSHKARVTNADGASMQVLFSFADEGQGGIPVYENNLALPLGLEDFAGMDRLWGSLTAFDGSLYAMAASGAYQKPQGMWRYTIANNRWSLCCLPDDLSSEENVSPNAFVVYRGALYLYGAQPYVDDEGYDATRGALWRYNPSDDSWENMNIALPSGASICAVGDNLLILGGYYGNVSMENNDDGTSVNYALADLESGTLKKVAGEALPPEDIIDSHKVVTGGDKIYYSVISGDEEETTLFITMTRLTFDARSMTMMSEDLTAAIEGVVPEIVSSNDAASKKSHYALAGLPDGVAIVGSSTRGDDTHVIYNGSSEAVSLGRTSTYHTVFEPLASYYDGQLYALGITAAEPSTMYFRSTHIHRSYDAGKVTTQPTCTQPGECAFTCSECGEAYTRPVAALGHLWADPEYVWSADGSACIATRVCRHDPTHKEAAQGTVVKAVAKKPTYAKAGVALCVATFDNAAFWPQIKRVVIGDLPGIAVGKTAVVSGNTYKVTSNTENTVAFTKAKNAATVTVPATVKIDGKIYKVTSIAAKAFASAKSKVKTVKMGKNVKTIGASAFAGCVKLTKVTGGAAVDTIGANAFAGCKMLATCAPLSSRALTRIGASACKNCAKIKVLTLKTKLLTMPSVKNSLKDSKVVTVKVSVGSAALNKTYAGVYEKLFTKPNCGKTVTVKA